MLLFALFAGQAAATDITTCQTLSSAGTTYDLTQNAASVTGGCFPITANTVTLNCHGFTIDGDDSGASDFGVSGTGRTGLVVKNCIIHDFAECVDMDNWDSSTFLNNTCDSQNQAANAPIRIRTGSDNNQILNNTITTSTTIANIYIDGTTTGTTIEGNTCTSLQGVCIDLNGTASNYIINNNTVQSQTGGGGGVAGGPAGIIINGGTGNTISNNSILNSRSTSYGIWLLSGSSGTVSGNRFIDDAGNGLFLNGATSMAMSDNIYSGMTLAAINISTATSNTFNREFIYNQTTYISSSTATSSTFTNTTLGYNATVGWANFTSFTLANRNIVENTDINVDPEFVSVDETVAAVLNVTALIKLVSDYNCYEVSAYKAAGFPNSRVNIYNTGSFFITANCTVGANSASFYVQNFSGYALGFSVYLMNYTNYPLGAVSNISSIFYITFYDEASGAPLNIDGAALSYNVWNSGLADVIVRNYSISYAGAGTVGNATINAHPNWTWANISGIETFTKASYTSRNRFLNFANTSLNVTQNISVYLLPLADASYAIMTVVDQGEAVPGVYIKILKYFASNSTYTLIDEKVSNSNGQAATYIDPIAYYKFLITDANGNQIFLSSAPEQFICDTTCKITIDISEGGVVDALGPYASSTCTENVTANTVTCTYSDPTGKTSSVNLLIYRQNSHIPAYNNTISASAAQWVVNMTAIGENLSAYWYQWEIWRTASPSFLHNIGIFDDRIFQAIQDWGIALIVMILVLGTAAAGPAMAVGLAGIAMPVITFMGLTQLGFAVTVPIMVVFFGIAFLLAKRGTG